MALTEKQEYKVEILPPYNILQVRRADIVEKDGVEIGRSYHRHMCVPGDDVSTDCAVVQTIAPLLWTTDVVTAYEASVVPEPQPEPEPESVPLIETEPETEPEVEVTPEPDEPQPEPNEEESN